MMDNAIFESDLRILSNISTPPRKLAAKAQLIQQQTRSSFYFIVEGWAAYCKYLSDGRRQIVSLYLPGDVCNLDSIVTNQSDYGIVGITSCVVTSVPVERIRTMAENSSTVRDLLWRLMLRESAISLQWLYALGRRSTRESLAHLLCELHERLAAVGLASDCEFKMPLTQQELGDCLGVSFVHINRTFQLFKDEKLVEFKDRRMKLVGYDALREISEFDPTYLKL